MGMVDGRTIWDGAMPGATPEFRRETYNAMIDTLAQLHRVDVDAMGLSYKWVRVLQAVYFKHHSRWLLTTIPIGKDMQPSLSKIHPVQCWVYPCS